MAEGLKRSKWMNNAQIYQRLQQLQLCNLFNSLNILESVNVCYTYPYVVCQHSLASWSTSAAVRRGRRTGFEHWDRSTRSAVGRARWDGSWLRAPEPTVREKCELQCILEYGYDISECITAAQVAGLRFIVFWWSEFDSRHRHGDGCFRSQSWCSISGFDLHQKGPWSKPVVYSTDSPLKTDHR